ncbi:MAG: signal peptidase I [Armatimonadota bacterium]|nr:signal peptidase I [Armatimonadota bacterium]
MEWFASMPIQWVIVIVIALLAIRFYLGRMQAKWAKSIAETAESLALAFALVFLIIRPFLIQAYYIPSQSMETGLHVKDHLLANKLVYRLREPRHGEIVVFKSPPKLEALEGKKDFIKRVIGEPGDTIEVKEGLVYVDGKAYSHSQLDSLINIQSNYDEENAIYVKLHKDYISVTEDNKTSKITKKEIAEEIGNSDAKIVIRPGVVIRNGKPLNEYYTAEDPDYNYSKVKVPRGNLFVMGDNRNNSLDSHTEWGFLPIQYVQGKAMFNFWPPNRIGLIR